MSRTKFGALGVVVSLSIALPRIPASPPAGERTTHGGDRAIRGFPLSFVENRGQWRDDILFAACRGGAVASFLERGLRLHVAGAKASPSARSLSLTFEGGCPSEVVGENATPAVFSFLRGPSPGRERSRVRSYESILYRELYPGVDARIREAVAEEPSRQIEYDLLVAPGAPLEAIVLRCEEVDAVEVDADGALLLTAGQAAVRQPPPVSWHVLPSGDRRTIECRVVMLDARRFTFAVPDRDPALPLVIDPVISFATYLGGAGEDFIFGLALEPDGVVAAGFTNSTLPFGGNALGDDEYGGGRYDGFVARLDAGLRELRSFTYLGGSGEERLLSVARTSTGRIAVVGYTSSAADFPTTAGAAQTTHGGGALDGFLTVLDPTGTSIEYSTFLGGPGRDSIMSVIVDTLDRIVVAGVSRSPSFETWPGFPAPAGGFQERNNGAADVVVLRLNVGPDVPLEDQVEYGTFLGGGGNETHEDWNWDAWRSMDETNKPDLVLGEANSVFVTGVTDSSNFPTTAGCFQPSYKGAWDGFVCWLSLDRERPPAEQLVYSTFLGGSSAEAGHAISLDPSGDVWVSGFTYSSDFPTTPDAYARTISGNDDVFFTRLRVDGALPPEQQLVYSSLIGGSGWDYSQAHIVDETGTITLVGDHSEGTFPMTEPGGSMGFIARFSPQGDDGTPPYVLRYSSTVGGMFTPFAIARIPMGDYFVATNSGAAGLPGFEGAYQQQSGGSWESGIVRASLKIPTACFALDPAAGGAAPTEVRADAACSDTPEGTTIVDYRWDFGDGTPEVVSDRPEVTHVFSSAGRWQVTLTVTNDEGLPSTASRHLVAGCPPTDASAIAPWMPADIGEPAVPGSARWSDGDKHGCLALCGSGKSLAGRAENCLFVHQAVSGDFTLEARIPVVPGAAANHDVGVMLRESPAEDARVVAMIVRGSANSFRPRFQWRETAGEILRADVGDLVEFPVWVKIQRTGNLLIGSSSTDGESWTRERAFEFPEPMPADLLAGIVAAGMVRPGATSIPAFQVDVCDIAISGPEPFARGNVNGEPELNLSDAVFILNDLFTGTDKLSCQKSADLDDSGTVDITDPVRLLGYLFLGYAPPSPPFPDCGVDPTPDALTCESYPACR